MRFAGAVVRKTYVDAGMWLKRKANHPLLFRVESFGALGYGHHFRLESPDDVDDAPCKLMHEAYQIGIQVNPPTTTTNKRVHRSART